MGDGSRNHGVSASPVSASPVLGPATPPQAERHRRPGRRVGRFGESNRVAQGMEGGGDAKAGRITRSARRRFSASGIWRARMPASFASVIPGRASARARWRNSGAETTSTRSHSASPPVSNSSGMVEHRDRAPAGAPAVSGNRTSGSGPAGAGCPPAGASAAESPNTARAQGPPVNRPAGHRLREGRGQGRQPPAPPGPVRAWTAASLSCTGTRIRRKHSRPRWTFPSRSIRSGRGRSSQGAHGSGIMSTGFMAGRSPRRRNGGRQSSASTAATQRLVDLRRDAEPGLRTPGRALVQQHAEAVHRPVAPRPRGGEQRRLQRHIDQIGHRRSTGNASSGRSEGRLNRHSQGRGLASSAAPVPAWPPAPTRRPPSPGARRSRPPPSSARAEVRLASRDLGTAGIDQRRHDRPR